MTTTPKTVVDSQVHIWAPDSPDRPWPQRGGNLRHRFIAPDDLVAEMDEAGVTRAVLVPPAFEGDRNDAVLAAAHRYPDRFAVMGRLALDRAESRAVLRRWRDMPGMLGIRQSFHLPEHRALLHDGTADWFWPAAQAAGIPVYVYCPGSLDLIGDIACRHPDLRLAISHLALTPDAAVSEVHAAATRVLALARHRNVAVKISALPRHAGEPFPFRGLRAPIRDVVDHFGAHRVFWGSDLTRLPCSYREAVRFMEQLDVLSEPELALVMGAALLEWLGWASAPASMGAKA